MLSLGEILPAEVDLLKMDIEGGEAEVFRTFDASMLARLRRIAMEYHPGVEVELLRDKLAGSGFSTKMRDDGNGYGMLFALNESAAAKSATDTASVIPKALSCSQR